ncbi:MAG: InlB B-repeat-containing protein [Blautia wexlerae]
MWELFSGELPDGLTLKQTTGEISGTPTAEQTAQFTVRALNSVGNDKKELSITITNAPAAEHTITVTTAGGGTASASSTSATAGTEITLTATPNTGYHFKEWQVESLAGLVITNNKFTMPDSNVAIKAIFEEDSPFAPTKHTVTVKTDGNGIAFASPLLAVAGTEITLTAMPKEGYHFKEWQVISGGVAIENNKFLMPDTNVEVKAFFEEGAPPAPTKYTVTVTTEGGGTASASPAKTAAGTEITLTATPNTGYHFKEWQVESPAGLVITNNKFTMPDSNVAIKAIFEEDSPFAPTKHTVTVKTDGNGIAFASPLLAVAGTEITLTAMPKKGYHFKEWQVISGGVAIENNKFLMPDSNVEVNAVFEKDAPPAPTDPGKPSISVTGAYTYNGSEHTATVSGYNPATMDIAGNTATDAGDYTVRVTSKTGRWADGSTGAVTAAWSIGKATQEAPNGLIGVAPTTEGGSDGKITGVDATMEYRAESETIYTTCTGIEIENLPAGNYFVRYAEDHNHFASPDAEVTVGEGTPLADCTITFNASDGSGSMDSVTVNAGTIYILPACGFTAPADQEFKAWEIGGTEYKVGDSYTVLVDTEIKALWENSVITPTTYTVTVSNDGNGTASASHAKAAAGTEITLTATPQIGYHFKEWQVMSGGMTIKDNKFIMPDTNVEIKAIFEEDAPPAPTEFIVTFDGNGGTPSVGSMTTTDRKLTSLPSASRSGSYSFYGWYTEKSGGTKITTDTVFHANATVYAHWTYTGGGGGGYNPPVTYYTLRFETGGGSDIPSVQGTYNTYIDLTKYVPTWRGHAFIGWYSERSLTNKVSGVYLTKDMTVYAGWRVDENPGTDVNPFTDISEKDWFYGDVMFVYENGLMLGTSKTLFSPHGTVMRGMMATILWRMEGSPVPKGKNSFTDVEAGKWYADAITWTAENGIFAGYGKDKFGPDDPITREQLAAIFYRYADYKGYDLTVKGDLDKFKDADKITDYAKTAMQWAVGSGLVKGKSGNLLDPQGTATRAEIAAMLHRFIEKYKLVQGKAPGGLMGWIDPKRLQIPKTGDSSV